MTEKYSLIIKFFRNFAEKMEQDKLIIIHEALNEASYLISNEIQCVIDEDLYSEYNRVLEKIDSALQIIKKYKSTP